MLVTCCVHPFQAMMRTYMSENSAEVRSADMCAISRTFHVADMLVSTGTGQAAPAGTRTHKKPRPRV